MKTLRHLGPIAITLLLTVLLAACGEAANSGTSTNTSNSGMNNTNVTNTKSASGMTYTTPTANSNMDNNNNSNMNNTNAVIKRKAAVIGRRLSHPLRECDKRVHYKKPSQWLDLTRKASDYVDEAR